jgi:fibronectin-binding autotransporter adhesin
VATRTWVGTTSTSWGTTTNWLEGAVPLSTDDVVIAAVPLNDIVLNTSARVCKSIDFTNFGTRTITFTNTLTVSGSITLISTMVLAGSASLIAASTGTLTSNGLTFNTNLNLTAQAGVLTLADNWTVTGTLTLGNNSSATRINSNTINVGGNLTMVGATLGTSTTVLNINGTGTWSGNAQLALNTTINTAGTLTISGTVEYHTNTLTYTAGTISAGTSTLNLGRVATTLACGGMTGSNAFANIGLFAANTVTLTGNLECSGSVTGNSNGVSLAGAYTFTVMGNLDMSSMATASLTSTTTKIVMGGTGFIKSPTTTGQIKIDLEINTSGTTTIFGTVNFSTQTFKYTTGTIAGSSTPVLNFRTTAATCTLNANFVFAGTITTAVNTVFNGTNGYDITTFTCITAGVSNTWAIGKTYIQANTTLTGTAASNVVFVSGTPTSSYTWTVTPGGTIDVGFVDATDADSSLGRTIWDYKGTLLRTVNWNAPTTATPASIGYITIN